MKLLTGEQAKQKVWHKDGSLKAWARKQGFNYFLVSNVVRGVNKASRGSGYEIAVKLGMKVAA